MLESAGDSEAHYSEAGSACLEGMEDRADNTAFTLLLRRFGTNAPFRQRTVEVPLKKGPNRVSVLLSNDTGSNHGGWAFAFRATAPDGSILVPRAAGK